MFFVALHKVPFPARELQRRTQHQGFFPTVSLGLSAQGWDLWDWTGLGHIQESLPWDVPDFTREETEQATLVTFSAFLRAPGSELGKHLVPSAGISEMWDPRNTR